MNDIPASELGNIISRSFDYTNILHYFDIPKYCAYFFTLQPKKISFFIII